MCGVRAPRALSLLAGWADCDLRCIYAGWDVTQSESTSPLHGRTGTEMRAHLPHRDSSSI